jgi:hypothetical protein
MVWPKLGQAIKVKERGFKPVFDEPGQRRKTGKETGLKPLLSKESLPVLIVVEDNYWFERMRIGFYCAFEPEGHGFILASPCWCFIKIKVRVTTPIPVLEQSSH